MQISHLEAKTLIQYSSDSSLTEGEKKVLALHLTSCSTCFTFAKEIKEVEVSLQSIAKQFTNIPYTPLSANIFTRKRNLKNIWLPQLMLVSISCIFLVLGAWQFSQVDWSPISNTPLQVAPIPTPSITLTNTLVFSQDCQNINYTTQQGDTLESIAKYFNISSELIQNKNNLYSTDLKVGTKLLIPLCDVTPSLTINPPTFTTTYSPTTALTAYTP